MQTIKIEIKSKYQKQIIEYQRQYSIIVHICFNYLHQQFKNNNLKSLFEYKKATSQLMSKIRQLKGINLLKNWLIQSGISQSYSLIKSFQSRLQQYKDKLNRKQELLNQSNRTKKQKKELRKLFKLKQPKVIFGGKSNFYKRAKLEISKEEFRQKKLSLIYSIGNIQSFGNRLFRIKEDLSKIIFQPKCKQKYQLQLIGLTKGYKEILKKLYLKQQLKELPITYKLSKNYIYISFQEQKLYQNQFKIKRIKDRYMSLDLNPNYIGYSIIDWYGQNNFKIIDKGVYSFKQLNDIFKLLKSKDSSDEKKIYLTNKRNYQIIEVAKNLINKCNYYRVQNFVVEDLNIKVCDRNKGKDFNRLCNNIWIRNRFLNNIQKRCKIFGINYLEVKPEYSSFTGNIIFRYLNLPDMVLSSIQLSRRGYQFRHQYILKDKEVKKNIVRIDVNNNRIFKDLFIKSMEEFNIQESFKDIIDVYYYFKRNPKLCYRISLDNFSSSFRYFSTNLSRVNRYLFLSIL